MILALIVMAFFLSLSMGGGSAVPGPVPLIVSPERCFPAPCSRKVQP